MNKSRFFCKGFYKSFSFLLTGFLLVFFLSSCNKPIDNTEDVPFPKGEFAFFDNKCKDGKTLIQNAFSPQAPVKEIKLFWECISKSLHLIYYAKSKETNKITLSELEGFLIQLFEIKSKMAAKKIHQAVEAFNPFLPPKGKNKEPFFTFDQLIFIHKNIVPLFETTHLGLHPYMSIYLNQWDASKEKDPYKSFERAQKTFVEKTSHLSKKLFDFLFLLKNPSPQPPPSNLLSSLFKNFTLSTKSNHSSNSKSHNVHEPRETQKVESILGFVLDFLSFESFKRTSYEKLIRETIYALEPQKTGDEISEKEMILKAIRFSSKLFMSHKYYNYFLSEKILQNKKTKKSDYLSLIQSINSSIRDLLTHPSLNSAFVIKKSKLIDLLPFVQAVFPQTNIQKLEQIIHIAFKLNFVLGGNPNRFALEDSHKMDMLIETFLPFVEKYSAVSLLDWPPPEIKDKKERDSRLEEAKKYLSRLADNLKPLFKNTYFDYRKDLDTFYSIFNPSKEEKTQKYLETIKSVQQIIFPNSPHITPTNWSYLLNNVSQIYVLLLEYIYKVKPFIEDKTFYKNNYPVFSDWVKSVFQWLNAYLETRDSPISLHQLTGLFSKIVFNQNFNQKDTKSMAFIRKAVTLLIARINKAYSIPSIDIHKETVAFLEKAFTQWEQDMSSPTSALTQTQKIKPPLKMESKESLTSRKRVRHNKDKARAELKMEAKESLTSRPPPLISGEGDLLFNQTTPSNLTEEHFHNLNIYKALARILLQLYASRDSGHSALPKLIKLKTTLVSPTHTHTDPSLSTTSSTSTSTSTSTPPPPYHSQLHPQHGVKSIRKVLQS